MESYAEDYYDHPVFKPLELMIETPAIELLSDQLHQWLWTGATGALIKGEARTGKTKAMEAMAGRLMSRSNKPIPVHHFSIHRRDTKSIRSLFRNMCISAKISTTPRTVADELSDSFIHYLLDMVYEYETDRIVLIVDETQRLKAWQFDAFAELYDELRKIHKVALMVIFVANDPECDDLIKEIQEPIHAHIYGRFFTLGTSFKGLTSEKAVKSCLEEYDTLRYPLKSGPTYTEYFLPNEFRQGWRLASYSRLIWSAYRQYKIDFKLHSWGMQYFIATINTLLTDFLPHNGVDKISEEMVSEAIKVSGMIVSRVKIET